MNKKMIIAIVAFVTGTIGTGLFSIAKSNVLIAEATLKAANMTSKYSDTTNGILMIACIVVAALGLVYMIKEFVKKDEK